MIIDEAHRAKGDGSAFNEALSKLGDCAKRKLILTATPFSIRLAELSSFSASPARPSSTRSDVTPVR
jgi:superfamily II DNA or RNA helicase